MQFLQLFLASNDLTSQNWFYKNCVDNPSKLTSFEGFNQQNARLAPEYFRLSTLLQMRLSESLRIIIILQQICCFIPIKKISDFF